MPIQVDSREPEERVGRDETGETDKYQALKSLVVHGMAFLLLPKVSGKLLESFKQGNDVIQLKLLKGGF